MSPFLKSNYLLINIPEYKLHIVENNQSVYEANVVVGKAATQTEIFKDTVSEVVFNPYWNIPASIVNTEILPKMQKDSNYLLQNDLEVVSASPMVIRQKPSSNNALGKMKFLFPNSYDIYLHDTPAKELFKSTNRAFSHGCIRLENPIKLALYLLKNNANWSKEKIETVLKSNVETSVSIVPKVAICIIYLTAWVNEKNELNFRNDIYQLDQKPIVNHFNQ
jgi:L,D-transpeptidase YcbB